MKIKVNVLLKSNSIANCDIHTLVGVTKLANDLNI